MFEDLIGKKEESVKEVDLSEKIELLLYKPQTYECQIHGKVTNTVTFSDNGVIRPEILCAECYWDLLSRSCQRVKVCK